MLRDTRAARAVSYCEMATLSRSALEMAMELAPEAANLVSSTKFASNHAQSVTSTMGACLEPASKLEDGGDVDSGGRVGR